MLNKIAVDKETKKTHIVYPIIAPNIIFSSFFGLERRIMHNITKKNNIVLNYKEQNAISYQNQKQNKFTNIFYSP